MREKIIDTAIEEFTKNGLKFTMNDVAKALGISKNHLYRVREQAGSSGGDRGSICRGLYRDERGDRAGWQPGYAGEAGAAVLCASYEIL